MEHKLAITHAAGIAAGAILENLARSGLAADALFLLDEEARVGAKLGYAGTYLSILNQREFDYSNCSMLALLQADDEIERQALAKGCLLISHEIDSAAAPIFLATAGQQLDLSYGETSLRLAGPELCCLLPLLTALDKFSPIAQLNMTFLRSAEFHGNAGVDELATQTINLLNSRDVKPAVFPKQIAFNLLTAAADSKICSDLSYFLGNRSCFSSLQTVNVSVFHGFAAALQIQFATKINLKNCRKLLSSIENVIVKNATISPISDCNQSFTCVISHLEQAPNQPSSLRFWVVADPMRYGLANNYVNVTEFLLKSFL